MLSGCRFSPFGRSPTLPELHDIVTITLGGRAADMALGGGPNAGAETDLAYATGLLLAARQCQALHETLVSAPTSGSPGALLKEVDADLKRKRLVGAVTG